jgi:hypothetical protein
LGVLDACQKRGDWKPLGEKMSEFDIRLPSSSAKGGLKVVTVSLVEEESGFAAELAALTAGAKLVGTYNGKLTPAQARSIFEIRTFVNRLKTYSAITMWIYVSPKT